MSTLNLDPRQWAQQQFGDCQLGDVRRTKRLVTVAAQAATRPQGSTPDQTESWGECKAVYRLMDCSDVTHAEIIRPHCERTRRAGAPGTVKLILCDTTELDFQRNVDGLGPVGRGSGRGFFLHTGLLRDADSGRIEGLAGQLLFHRRPKSQRKTHKNSQRRDPERESVAWGQLIDQIGVPPQGVRWLHVCDRGADDYEVYCRAALQGCGWVVRVAHRNRIVQPVESEDMEGEAEVSLEELLARQEFAGQRALDVPRQGSRQARTAQVRLRGCRRRGSRRTRGRNRC